MWKQWVIAAVLIAFAAAGAGWYLSLSSSPADTYSGAARVSKVSAVTPEVRILRDEVAAVANLKAADAVELVAEASGRVVEFNLAPGQRILRGTLILRLDDRQARADVAVIEAELEDARKQLQRARSLRSSNSVAQSRVDELVTAVSVAEARLSAARVRLQNHSITAPFDGVAGLSDVGEGTYLQMGDVITTLDNTDRMELRFAIPERFLGQVRPGQAVCATSPAFPDIRFTGELVQLDSRVNELSRSLSARALIDNRDGRLRPGQFMSASLTLAQREGLVIPEQAVMIRGDDKYVFVAEDGVARRVSVQTGARLPGLVEVMDGLSPTDSVVVTGQDRLSTGERVEVLDPGQAIPPNRFVGSLEP